MLSIAGQEGEAVLQSRAREKQNQRPDFALSLSVFNHTSLQQFGKVMAMTQPRLAVGYHFFNDFDTTPLVLQDIRRT